MDLDKYEQKEDVNSSDNKKTEDEKDGINNKISFKSFIKAFAAFAIFAGIGIYVLSDSDFFDSFQSAPVKNASVIPEETPEPTSQPSPEPTPTPTPEPEPTPGPTIEEQKEYYETTTRHEIDSALEEYDLIWSSLWIPTFEGLSNGSLGSVEAWGNLDTAEKRYSELYRSTISTEGLSDELKKKVGAFTVELEDAIALRNEAISQAKKMIDDNDFAPSTINKIQGYIDDADNMVIQGMAYILELEQELGINR